MAAYTGRIVKFTSVILQSLLETIHMEPGWPAKREVLPGRREEFLFAFICAGDFIPLAGI